MSPDRLLAEAQEGNQRALARLATLVENPGGHTAVLRQALYQIPSQARIVGITGPPGAGKSSLIGAIAEILAQRGDRVAVIAIDPTSPLSGGAALGDRIRMSKAALLPGVFVRSLASRTREDALAPAASDMIRLFDAAGFDYVFVETVGSGQNQVQVAAYVHTLVLVEAPGAGDGVQMLKAGVMELADIYAVAKSDLPGAHHVGRELQSMLTLADSGSDWQPPVVLCSTETGEGVETIVHAIDDHAAWLRESGALDRRRLAMARAELHEAVMRWVGAAIEGKLSDDLARDVADRRLSPDEAIRQVVEASLSRPAAGSPGGQ
jgi:LAO/AO transport system kinase